MSPLGSELPSAKVAYNNSIEAKRNLQESAQSKAFSDCQSAIFEALNMRETEVNCGRVRLDSKAEDFFVSKGYVFLP